MTTVKVRIQGAYENGHTYDRLVEVPAPESQDDLDDGEWWNEYVWPETGDGVYEDIGSDHEATILESSNPLFIGATYGWGS